MNTRVMVLSIAAAAVFFQWCAVAAANNVEIILDASGSMAAKIEEQTKMEIAKKAVYELLLTYPESTQIAIRTYGHRRKDDCRDIELIVPFGKRDLSNFSAVINLKCIGKTPLAAAITAAAQDFAGKEGQENSIILITDGEETCGGDPCKAAKEAHRSGIKVKIDVIGFKIEARERAQLECIAREGGGKYIAANNAKELVAATQQVAAAPAVAAEPKPAPAPPPPPMTANPKDKNILAQANGGQLLIAPSDAWSGTNDGKEEVINLMPGEESVYAFKDEQPATFDNFATLVNEASNWNLKEFELLVSDDSPTGSFRSLGTFTAQNAKMLKSPYQQFKFEPVTAKYLKLKLISNYGGYKNVRVSEFRILGETNVKGAAEPGAPAAAAKKEETNILSVASGGQLLVATNDTWASLNDGKEDVVNLKPFGDAGQEAVFAFKNEQPATFDRFATLVTEASNWNLKTFELLAGDDSPTGSFRSIGTFTVQNAKMLKSPYQEFKFEPVTAKYLKVKLISNYGAYNALNVAEFKVFGKPAATAEGGTSPAPPKPVPAAAKVNLLSAANGGQLLVAPDDSWSAVIDGKEDLALLKPAGELVFAFKDEKPATFDTFATLVTETADWNLKDFELLVGDESPTGSFRSVGTFTVQNVKMLKSPYQEFKFEPVTAKYLKVKIIANYGAYNKLLLGEFKVHSTAAK
jgi:hypothetical protein